MLRLSGKPKPMLNVEQIAETFVRNLEEQNPQRLLALASKPEQFRRTLNQLAWDYTLQCYTEMKGKEKNQEPEVEEALTANLLAPEQPGYDPLHPPTPLSPKDKARVEALLERWVSDYPEGRVVPPETLK